VEGTVGADREASKEQKAAKRKKGCQFPAPVVSVVVYVVRVTAPVSALTLAGVGAMDSRRLPGMNDARGEKCDGEENRCTLVRSIEVITSLD
jgi:hypothetical protein